VIVGHAHAIYTLVSVPLSYTHNGRADANSSGNDPRLLHWLVTSNNMLHRIWHHFPYIDDCRQLSLTETSCKRTYAWLTSMSDRQTAEWINDTDRQDGHQQHSDVTAVQARNCWQLNVNVFAKTFRRSREWRIVHVRKRKTVTKTTTTYTCKALRTTCNTPSGIRRKTGSPRLADTARVAGYFVVSAKSSKLLLITTRR